MSISTLPLTVLCIPGMWKDRSELVTQIAKLSGGYIFAGQVLMDSASGTSFELDVRDHDPRMAVSFSNAGPHWRGTEEMRRIKDHAMVTYIVGDGGSSDRAKAFMKAAAGLIHAGGLGVKVESAGLAFSPVDWLRLTGGILAVHRAFVIYATGETTYSCGMHNLGLRDAIVESKYSKDPVELLRMFTQYVYIEKPELRVGHTFHVDQDAPRYRLSEQAEPLFDSNHLFHNPYGLWRLTPA